MVAVAAVSAQSGPVEVVPQAPANSTVTVYYEKLPNGEIRPVSNHPVQKTPTAPHFGSAPEPLPQPTYQFRPMAVGPLQEMVMPAPQMQMRSVPIQYSAVTMQQPSYSQQQIPIHTQPAMLSNVLQPRSAPMTSAYNPRAIQPAQSVSYSYQRLPNGAIVPVNAAEMPATVAEVPANSLPTISNQPVVTATKHEVANAPMEGPTILVLPAPLPNATVKTESATALPSLPEVEAPAKPPLPPQPIHVSPSPTKPATVKSEAPKLEPVPVLSSLPEVEAPAKSTPTPSTTVKTETAKVESAPVLPTVQEVGATAKPTPSPIPAPIPTPIVELKPLMPEGPMVQAPPTPTPPPISAPVPTPKVEQKPEPKPITTTPMPEITQPTTNQPPVPPVKTDETRESLSDYGIETSPPSAQRLFRLESEAELRARIAAETVKRPIKTGEQPNVSPEFPTYGPLSEKPYEERQFGGLIKQIEPNYVCHGRLYLEELNADRYGWEMGVLQPAFSAGKAWFDMAFLPYNFMTRPFQRYDCSAGKCFPGDPVPMLVYPPELSATGAGWEASLIYLGFILIP